MRYTDIVFMQGDEADEILDALCSRESPDSVVYHGATSESIATAVETLKAWESGDETSYAGEPRHGSQDSMEYHGGYVLSWNLGLGYVGLSRVAIAEDEPRSLSGAEMDAYRRAYVTAMCWANSVGEADDGSDAEDYGAIEESLTDAMRAELHAQADAFMASELSEDEADQLGLDHGDTVETVIAALTDSHDYTYEASQAGHDYALTRNGHGTGFWDRGLGLVGEILTAHSRPFGEAHVYVKDDQAVGVED